MSVWMKVKALQFHKERSFRILLVVELLLLALGIAGLFGKNAVYVYGADAATVLLGEYRSESAEVSVNSESGTSGHLVEFQGIVLPKGTYRINLQYETDTNAKNSLEITDESLHDGQLRFNPILLYAGWDHTDEEMWLLRDTGTLIVHAGYGGEGQFAVRGLSIQQTNAANRIFLFCLICLFIGINLIYLWVKYDRKYQIPIKTKTVYFLLGMITLVASFPLMFDYMWSSGDLGYHLMRVEGIKDGILSGQFPIRISPQWQQGYGYASPIFYGETMLYLAGMFRLIGFSVTTSYRLFMFVITVLTVLISYSCFRRIFRDEYVGVFCSALHTLSIFRFCETYLCGLWGECLGIMALPLLALGFYQVFTQDIRQERYKRSWIPLAVGFALLIQSHLLSCEIVGLFTIFLCIVLWKKIFRPQTFLALVKTVICSVLLSLWFVIPFVDYMLTGDFVIQHVSKRTIQERGLYPAHLFLTFFENGGNVFYKETGMTNGIPMGIGMVLMLALVLFLWLLWRRRLDKITIQEKALGKITSGFAVLAMIMSLNLFPWDRIQFANRMTETLVSSVQFPKRFLLIATLCLIMVAGVLAKQILQDERKWKIAGFFAGSILCLTCGSVYLAETVADRAGAVRVYNSQGMGTGYISGAEYLPYGANASLFMPHDPVGTEGISVTDYEKKSLGAQAQVVNDSEKKGELSFALLYYKGYRAYDRSSGEEFPCYAGVNFEVTVELPPVYQGMVDVRFESPWYWRAGEAVSLLSVILLIAFSGKRRLKLKKLPGF